MRKESSSSHTGEPVSVMLDAPKQGSKMPHLAPTPRLGICQTGYQTTSYMYMAEMYFLQAHAGQPLNHFTQEKAYRHPGPVLRHRRTLNTVSANVWDDKLCNSYDGGTVGVATGVFRREMCDRRSCFCLACLADLQTAYCGA